MTPDLKEIAIDISTRSYRALIPDLYKGKVGVEVEEAKHVCIQTLLVAQFGILHAAYCPVRHCHVLLPERHMATCMQQALCACFFKAHSCLLLCTSVSVVNVVSVSLSIPPASYSLCNRATFIRSFMGAVSKAAHIQIVMRPQHGRACTNSTKL